MNKKVAISGMLLASSFILSYIEQLFPIAVGIPGIKLGFGNLVILLGFYLLPWKTVILIDICKVILGNILFGNVMAISFSMAGAICSFVCMYLLYKTKKFSPIGISAAGGVFHNIGQIMVASIVVETYSVLYYLPVLFISGLLTGILLGIIGNQICKYIKIIDHKGVI